MIAFPESLRFQRRVHALAVAALEILEREKPMTLRSLYYQLVMAALIPATNKGYNAIMRVMTKLRQAEVIPLTGWLVDRTRTTLKPSSWSGLAEFGEVVRDAYRKDFWPSMPEYVCVFCEKDAIAGTIQPVTAEYDVPLYPIRGDVSFSFLGEIVEQWRDIDKPINAFYLGDWDPAGLDIERVLREKLRKWSGRDFSWTRLGVLEQDFEQFGLVELPVKESARTAAFVRRYGERCAEVDALPPTELRRRVLEAIEDHIDHKRWKKLQRVEEKEQALVDKLVKQWPAFAIR